MKQTKVLRAAIAELQDRVPGLEVGIRLSNDYVQVDRLTKMRVIDYSLKFNDREIVNAHPVRIDHAPAAIAADLRQLLYNPKDEEISSLLGKIETCYPL